jgi:type IV pilus assembly protein PilC
MTRSRDDNPPVTRPADARQPLGHAARFRWAGLDAHGARRRGTLVARDASAARAALRSRGMVVLKLAPAGSARARRLRDADLTRATRQLAGLLRAALPLLPALQLVAQHAPAALAPVLTAVANDVAGGLSFSAALARHPRAFAPLYCQLVSIGEATGSLDAILARIAADRERAARQRKKVRSALTYPLVVLLLALTITAALLMWVVPTFQQIFENFGAQLPAPTRAVLALSDAVAKHALLVGTACAITVSAALLAVQRSPRCRALADAAALRLPCVGTLLSQLCIARWSHALGTLLGAGVPLVDAFEVIAHASGNHVFDTATLDIGARVRRGERLASALRAVHCFPAEIVAPIAIAEESATLDAMLADLAALNDAQVDERIDTLSALAEPLIIVVLGALVGGLVIAMYLPIIELGSVV